MHPRSRPLGLAAALLLAVALAPVRAIALLETRVAVCRAPFDLAGDPTCAVVQGTVLAEATDLGPAGLFDFFGTGRATASFGALGFEGSFSLLSATEDVVCLRDGLGQLVACAPTVSARAAFDDVLTVEGASGSGTVVIHFHVGIGFAEGCGTVEPCPPQLVALDGSFLALFEAGTPGAPDLFASQAYDSFDDTDAPPVGGALETLPVPIVFGDPFPLVVALEEIATGPDLVQVEAIGPVAFWNSQGALAIGATLVSIEVFDENGAPVPGATVSAASGAVYPVPEPGPAAAALAAGLALAALARANSQQLPRNPPR